MNSNSIEEIKHINVWFTDKLREIMKNQSNHKLRLLFKPFFTSFRRMSIFFGLPYHYLPAQRMVEYSKKPIASRNLKKMKNSLERNIYQLQKDYQELTNFLIDTRNEISSFIDYYQEQFKPKPTSNSQIAKYHPNISLRYFSKINSIDKAYWLGFMFADG